MHLIIHKQVRSFSSHATPESGGKNDLGAFEHDMIVGARWTCLSNSEPPSPLRFSATTVYSHQLGRKKFSELEHLLRRRVRGKCPDWFKLTESLG